MRCSFDVVNRIIHLSTERGMSRRALSSVSFDHLSISGCVLEVEEGRSKKSCKSLLNKSLTEDLEGIYHYKQKDASQCRDCPR
jgi:transposase